MPRVDHCDWNSFSVLSGESSKITVSLLLHSLPFFVLLEREVCFFSSR